MARYFDGNRRRSTVISDDWVHIQCNELRKEYGEVFDLLPKGFVYERLRERTGMCVRTIAMVLNHTQMSDETRRGTAGNGGGC